MIDDNDVFVIFNNGNEYKGLLPSKIFTCISFNKPLLILTKNEDSMLLIFYRDYRKLCVYRVGESIYKIKEFYDKYKEFSFDENYYVKYLKFLPKNALTNLIDSI